MEIKVFVGVIKKPIMTIIIIIVPVLILELVLRCVDYTYYPDDIGFHPTPKYQMVHRDGDQYRGIKDQHFDVEKTEKEFRVFLFGGSSIHYIPLEPLEEKLKTLVPEKNVNVINLGFGSWGSTRLLLLLREMIFYEPDLIIIYSGHNEFSERYVKEIFYKDNWMTDLNERFLAGSKSYQLFNLTIRNIMIVLAKAGMGMIKPKRAPIFVPQFDDFSNEVFTPPDRKQVYTNYKKNIIQMVRLAKLHKIPIIISTIAYNRLAYPSKPTNDLYYEGIGLYKAGEYKLARDKLQQGLLYDSVIRRATEESNAIIKDIAKVHNVPLADVDRAVVDASEHQIPGFDFFKDNCHLIPIGNEIMFNVFFETVRDNNILHKK
ncbi:SGNH/GDSL hydrolase family protein [Candidatus Omnitrophota bacterium]